MDPLSLIVGAGILAVGYLAGHLVGRRRRRAIGAATAAICGCGHPLSHHDAESGECHFEVRRRYSHTGEVEFRPCTCRRYDGPQPLESFFAPTILPPTDHQ